MLFVIVVTLLIIISITKSVSPSKAQRKTLKEMKKKGIINSKDIFPF